MLDEFVFTKTALTVAIGMTSHHEWNQYCTKSVAYQWISSKLLNIGNYFYLHYLQFNYDDTSPSKYFSQEIT